MKIITATVKKVNKIEKKLRSYQLLDDKLLPILNRYGRKGVETLSNATPIDTGKTASSWKYEIQKTERGYSVIWYNTNVVNQWCNVAIMIQYGHATRNGGWIEGRDYINPAIQPIFDEMVKTLEKEVSRI